MLNSPRVGFIGFGEVASVFSEALGARGAEVAAHDVMMDRPGGLDTLRTRDRTGGMRFLPLPGLVAGVDCVLSTVTTSVAVAAARNAAAHLRPGQTYVDLNATAPTIKREVAAIVSATGAHFVEGAILGAIGVTGAQTKILIGDERGEQSAEMLTRLGLNTVFYSREIGKASTFKMLRSVFSKGLEALLLEYLVAGKRAGIQDDLWQEIVELFTQNSFERVATNWIQTHATAHERRYHEVVQVAAVLRELGLEPVLTGATEWFFQRSGALALKDAFAGKKPTRDEVIAELERRLRAQSSNPKPVA